MQDPQDKSIEILTKYRAGITCSQLAKQYSVKYIAMWKALKTMGVVFQRTKLPKNVEKAMLADYQTGLGSTELGIKYNIAQASVCNYVRRAGIKPHESRRINTMNTQFFKTITSESAWVLGWYFSDGNVSKSSNQFSITVHSNDEALVVKIQAVMGFNTNPIYRPTSRKMVQFYANDDTIHSDLVALGCIPNKSLVIRYPVILTEDWQHWAFLRGVLEGDGHVSLKAKGNRPGFNCEISSGSLGFLQDIQLLLKTKLDIDTGIIERPNTNSKRLWISGGREPILRFLDLLYKDCPEHLRLERKYQTYLKMHEVTARPNAPMFANRETMRSGYFLSPEDRVYFVRGLKRFAVEMNLSIGCLINLLKPVTRRSKSHRYGWTRPTQDQIDAARASGTLIEKIY